MRAIPTVLLRLLCFSIVGNGMKFVPKVRPMASRYALQVVDMQICKNESIPGRIIFLSFDKLSLDPVFNIEMELFRRINSVTKAVAEFQHCADNTAASCQHFTTWTFHKETCTLMAESKNMFWSTLAEKWKPPLLCPLLPGRYSLRNGTIDVQALRQMPFPRGKYMWKTHFEAYDPALVFCATVKTRLVRTRLGSN